MGAYVTKEPVVPRPVLDDVTCGALEALSIIAPPLASTVLPRGQWRDYPQNQKARNYLKLRAYLVAGGGATTFAEPG